MPARAFRRAAHTVVLPIIGGLLTLGCFFLALVMYVGGVPVFAALVAGAAAAMGYLFWAEAFRCTVVVDDRGIRVIGVVGATAVPYSELVGAVARHGAVVIASRDGAFVPPAFRSTPWHTSFGDPRGEALAAAINARVARDGRNARRAAARVPIGVLKLRTERLPVWIFAAIALATALAATAALLSAA